MRYQATSRDDPFDGLTREDMARIRGAGAAAVTPGLEGLAGRWTKPRIVPAPKRGRSAVRGDAAASTPDPGRSETPKRKRGRRA